jgi:hypothetical protein
MMADIESATTTTTTACAGAHGSSIRSRALRNNRQWIGIPENRLLEIHVVVLIL